MAGGCGSRRDLNRRADPFALFDEMNRITPHAQFYPSDKPDRVPDALRHARLKRGLPHKLFVGKGPASGSKHHEEITASLGIALVHFRP